MCSVPHRMPTDRTQIIPFENASDLHHRIAQCLDLMNHWNAALTGHFRFDDVLKILCRQVNALNISLFRYADERAHPISTVASDISGAKPSNSTGSLLAFLLGSDPGALTPGSLWRLRAIRDMPGFDKSPAAREWQSRPQVQEVSLAILSNRDGTIDALELSFDHVRDVHPDIPPFLITTAMANAWDVALPGLIDRVIMARRRGSERKPDEVAVLSAENPYGLSRAELRVCHLLADGQTAKQIAEDLDLSVSTVRTHLRNIYSKTNTTGQVNLIALIQHQNKAK